MTLYEPEKLHKLDGFVQLLSSVKVMNVNTVYENSPIRNNCYTFAAKIFKMFLGI